MSFTSIPHQSNALISKTQRGFTLVELMVTIAIMAIIASLALPSFSNQLARQRMKSSASIFTSALKQAKTQSYLLKKDVTVTYNAATNLVIVADEDSNNIAQYTLNDLSDIVVTPTAQNVVTFVNGERADAVSYRICDDNGSGLEALVVSLDAIANVTFNRTGVCP